MVKCCHELHLDPLLTAKGTVVGWHIFSTFLLHTLSLGPLLSKHKRDDRLEQPTTTLTLGNIFDLGSFPKRFLCVGWTSTPEAF